MRYTDEWYAADTRVDAVAPFLGDPRRVLDFGAFSTATAETLRARFPGAEVVVVDDTITTPSSPGIEVVGERMTPAGIGKLGRFDATFALSVLHHLTHWRKYLAVLQKSAPILFVETAHPDEVLPKAKAHKHTAEMVAHLASIGEPVCETAGYDDRFQRTLWLIRG